MVHTKHIHSIEWFLVDKNSLYIFNVQLTESTYLKRIFKQLTTKNCSTIHPSSSSSSSCRLDMDREKNIHKKRWCWWSTIENMKQQNQQQKKRLASFTFHRLLLIAGNFIPDPKLETCNIISYQRNFSVCVCVCVISVGCSIFYMSHVYVPNGSSTLIIV